MHGAQLADERLVGNAQVGCPFLTVHGDFNTAVGVDGKRAQVRQDAVGQARLAHHRQRFRQHADLLRHLRRQVLAHQKRMRVRARLQLLGGNAQDARRFLRADVHGRVLQRGRHRFGERLTRAELRHRAVLPALRHGSKHAALDDHRVEVQLVARAAQQLAFAKLHDAGVYLFQQFETVLLGNAAKHRRRFQRTNVFQPDSHARPCLLLRQQMLPNVYSY